MKKIKDQPLAIYSVVERPVQKLLTEKGDVILDPFVGSGSTAVAAFQNERVYIGFDISEEYCLYAQKRVSSVKHQLSLWERNNAADAD